MKPLYFASVQKTDYPPDRELFKWQCANLLIHTFHENRTDGIPIVLVEEFNAVKSKLDPVLDRVFDAFEYNKALFTRELQNRYRDSITECFDLQAELDAIHEELREARGEVQADPFPVSSLTQEHDSFIGVGIHTNVQFRGKTIKIGLEVNEHTSGRFSFSVNVRQVEVFGMPGNSSKLVENKTETSLTASVFSQQTNGVRKSVQIGFTEDGYERAEPFLEFELGNQITAGYVAVSYKLMKSRAVGGVKTLLQFAHSLRGKLGSMSLQRDNRVDLYRNEYAWQKGYQQQEEQPLATFLQEDAQPLAQPRHIVQLQASPPIPPSVPQRNVLTDSLVVVALVGVLLLCRHGWNVFSKRLDQKSTEQLPITDRTDFFSCSEGRGCMLSVTFYADYPSNGRVGSCLSIKHSTEIRTVLKTEPLKVKGF